MRKTIFVFAVLLMLVAGAAWAGFSGTRTYFTTSAMTTATGAERLFCNGSTSWLWGTTANFRRFEGLHCETANDVVTCQQWNGTSWVSISCPY